MHHHRHLFIPGPTNVPDTVRRAMDLPMEDMRAPDFGTLTLPLFDGLRKVFKSSSAQVFIFPGSGTGGWEASLLNTLNPGDKVLAASLGQFSLLWVEMCRDLGLDVIEVEVEWGEGVPVDRFAQILKADRAHDIKAVLVTHNETATGVTSDVAGVRAALDDAGHPAMLFVDAVSSLASIDFRMDEWGVDIAVSGSQKGLMLPAGFAVVAASEKAMAAAQSSTLRRSYFSFAAMAAANASGHFPYTPPTTLLHGLSCALDLLFEEGLDNVFARHHRLGEGVRRAVAAWGLRLVASRPEFHSDTVSAIYAPAGVDARDVIAHAYARYNLSLGAGLNKLNGKVFRIGHLGALDEVMVLSALGGVEMVLKEVGADIELGSGVAAAQDWFTTTAESARKAA